MVSSGTHDQKWYTTDHGTSTGFDGPVVPDVNSTSATSRYTGPSSSSAGMAAARNSPAVITLAVSARNGGSSEVVLSPTTMTVARLGSGSRSASRSTIDLCTTSAAVSLRASASCSSVPTSAVFMGTSRA